MTTQTETTLFSFVNYIHSVELYMISKGLWDYDVSDHLHLLSHLYCETTPVDQAATKIMEIEKRP